MRLQFVLSEIGIGLRRNLSMTISVVLVTMVSLFFLGFGLLSHSQVDAMKDYWYDKVEVSIFLCGKDSPTTTAAAASGCAQGAATQAQKDQIAAELDALRPLVSKVYFESQAQAFTRFKQQFKDSAIVSNVTPDQMPESYRVKLSDPQRYALIARSFDGAPGVEQVQDQRRLLDRFFAILNGLTRYAIALAAVMLVCAVLLVATTIRLSAMSRRRETGIMRLVGASRLVIQLPFILETVLAAVVGTALAVGALYGVVHYGVQRALAPALPFTNFVGTGDVLAVLPWLALTGVAVAAVAAFLTLQRYLRV